MKKSMISVCFSGLVVFVLGAIMATTVSAEDDEDRWHIIPQNSVAKNFYGGVGLGLGDNDSPDSNQDGSVTGVDTDESDATKGVFFGYQFNDYVAVQGAYHDLGDSDFSGNSSGGPSWTAGPVRTKQEADGWELGVMGRWPISERWYALGFVGMFWWENKETYYESSGVSSITESGSDISYALGFEFDHGLKDRIVYRFMGAHHQVGDDDYDVNSASAAVIYRFP